MKYGNMDDQCIYHMRTNVVCRVADVDVFGHSTRREKHCRGAPAAAADAAASSLLSDDDADRKRASASALLGTHHRHSPPRSM